MSHSSKDAVGGHSVRFEMFGFSGGMKAARFSKRRNRREMRREHRKVERESIDTYYADMEDAAYQEWLDACDAESDYNLQREIEDDLQIYFDEMEKKDSQNDYWEDYYEFYPDDYDLRY